MAKNNYILGLNVYHGDSSACLLRNGELICAYEEERFTRFKHWAGFPKISILECLKDEGITIDEVEFITVSRDPKQNLMKKISFSLKNRLSLSFFKKRIANSKKVAGLDVEFAKLFNKNKQEFKNKICNIEHHRAHLASAFFASPFEESAILSIDALGDFCSTMFAIGRGNQIEVLDDILFPHSVGFFYTALTQYLGFNHYGDEYKVMGLAPYGEPKYLDKMEKILVLKPNGKFELDLKYFVHHKEGVTTTILDNNDPTPSRIYSAELENFLGVVRKKEEPLTQFHNDIATSVQRHCENTIFHILNHLQKITGIKNICIAGGVAQNSVANGKITERTPFTNVYIPSAGHDAGTSMGSALYQFNHVLKQPRQPAIYNAYTGSKFTNDEIETFLKSKNIKYSKLPDEELFDKVTDKLIEPGVVGWFNGRAEFGPRALGARSIIADPRNEKAKELLNLKIKRRESFRPFAPSILKEYVKDYFTKTEEVPFMEKVFPIKPEKHKEIPAVTHVDGTGRLQTVDKLITPRYYNLIDAFRKKTGVPILLNTSFNENEPIVNTPEEALNCFLRTQMDMLVLENCVIDRKDQI
jgi:carbamoyltransferase